MIMGLVLDFIVIGIVVLCSIMAAKKGFVRTLIELIGYILAIAVAISFSGVVADFVFDKFIEPASVTAIADIIEDKGTQALESVPVFIKSITEKAGVNFAELENAVGTSSTETASEIVNTSLKPIAVSIVKSIAIVVLAVLLLIVVRFLARFVNSLFKGALLGSANKLLGAILGGAKGVIFAILFCVLVSFISSILKTDFLFFTQATIESSNICKLILHTLKITF